MGRKVQDMKQNVNHFNILGEKTLKIVKSWLESVSSINTTIVTVFDWTQVPIPEYGDDDEEYCRDEYLQQRCQPVPLLQHRALPQHGGELLSQAHVYGGCGGCGSSAWSRSGKISFGHSLATYVVPVHMFR